MTTTDPTPGTDAHLTAILDGVLVTAEEEDTYGAERAVARPAAEDDDLREQLDRWAEARRRGWTDQGDLGVLARVAAELGRQHDTWGEQNHPDGTGEPWAIAVAAAARQQADKALADGKLTWRHILLEEVWEAVAETDPELLQVELVQVAAVAAQWAEAIDRRQAIAETTAAGGH